MHLCTGNQHTGLQDTERVGSEVLVNASLQINAGQAVPQLHTQSAIVLSFRLVCGGSGTGGRAEGRHVAVRRHLMQVALFCFAARSHAGEVTLSTRRQQAHRHSSLVRDARATVVCDTDSVRAV